ncbi:hypothetical protein PHLCEN_2v13701 [Hermanssonia centrifuga]|uniref:Uncharacterized protein n=1 Tax=Hermanssonia centrifuga TaxID=98765 RepID=A0A2R6NDL5_9APHY|nr:hypothetical protein PHLCEN_2v13701 [Hermanssonia centrifuga]
MSIMHTASVRDERVNSRAETANISANAPHEISREGERRAGSGGLRQRNGELWGNPTTKRPGATVPCQSTAMFCKAVPTDGACIRMADLGDLETGETPSTN